MRFFRVLPLILILIGAGVLWLTRPRLDDLIAPPSDDKTIICQSNLRRIALAFAQYAQDFDGKFPRGVDPEDRAPQTWNEGYGGEYSASAQSAPLLHELLAPYLRDGEVWHCPADVGWGATRPEFPSRLGAVAPSSFARFGTSYFYYTIHGFAELRPQDLPDPSRELLVFDGDFWHRSETGKSLNALFGDGHVENLTASKFNALGEEQTQFLESLSP